MKFRSLGASMLLVGLLVTAMVALRAADEKPKGKVGEKATEKATEEILPGPGEVKFTSAPPAVQKTFKDETNNSRIDLLGKGKNDEKDGEDKAVYRAIVGIGGSNYDLIVAASGQVLFKTLQPMTTEVTLEDCPAPVQKALQAEAKGAKVEVIKRIAAGKRSDFVMEVIVQKLPYQIIFSEDGTLMSKIFDDGTDAEDSSEASPVGTETPKSTEKKEPPKKEAEKPAKKK